MKPRIYITALLCLVGLMIGEPELATASPARISGEFFAGGVCEVTGVFATLWLGKYLKSTHGDLTDNQISEIGPLQYGTAVCMNALASSIGVYLVGTIDNETGSFLATLAGIPERDR